MNSLEEIKLGNSASKHHRNLIKSAPDNRTKLPGTNTHKGYKFIQQNMKSENGNHTWELGKNEINQRVTKMIKCYLCKQEIVKYRMDLGDTIIMTNLNNEEIFICDDCAKKIAKELIER